MILLGICTVPKLRQWKNHTKLMIEIFSCWLEFSIIGVVRFSFALPYLFLSIIFGWVSKENLFFGCSSNVNISLIHPFRDAFLKMIEEEVGHEVLNQQTLRKFAQKINFNLRLSEIVRQTSCTSNLVVMTLPVPKKDNVPTALYLSLLDFITRDMPPFFLVRGNQDSVLTFYSWRYTLVVYRLQNLFSGKCNEFNICYVFFKKMF